MIKFKTKTALMNFIHTFPLMETYHDQIMELYDPEMFVMSGFSSSSLYHFFLRNNMSVGNTLLSVPNMPISDEAVAANVGALKQFTTSLSNYSNQRFNIVSEERANILRSSALAGYVIDSVSVSDNTDFKKYYITEKTLLDLVMNKTELMCKYVSVGIKHPDLPEISSFPLMITDVPVAKKTCVFVHISEINTFYGMVPKANFTPELLDNLEDETLIKVAETSINKANIDTVTLSRVPSRIYTQISDEKKDELTKRIPKEISKNVRLSNPSESISMDYFVMIESLLESELIDPADMSQIVSNVYNEKFKNFVTKYDDKFPQISSMIDLHLLIND